MSLLSLLSKSAIAGFALVASIGQTVYAQSCSTDTDTSLIGNGAAALTTDIKLEPQLAQVIQIELTESADAWWQVGEVGIFKAGSSAALTSAAFKSSSSDPATIAPKRLIDGSMANRWNLWHTNALQTPGQHITLELNEATEIDCISLQALKASDYPRGYKVNLWGTTAEYQEDKYSETAHKDEIEFPSQPVRFVKVTQTGEIGRWWGISELFVQGSNGAKLTPTSDWVASASHSASYRGDTPNKAIDQNWLTPWTLGKIQEGGEYFQLDMGKTEQINRVEVVAFKNSNDIVLSPAALNVEVSVDGQKWYDPNNPPSEAPRDTTPSLLPSDLTTTSETIKTLLQLPKGFFLSKEHRWSATPTVNTKSAPLIHQDMAISASNIDTATPLVFTSASLAEANDDGVLVNNSSGIMIKSEFDRSTSKFKVLAEKVYPECKEMHSVNSNDDGSHVAALCRSAPDVIAQEGYLDSDYVDLVALYDAYRPAFWDGNFEHDYIWVYEWADGDITSKPFKTLVSKYAGGTENDGYLMKMVGNTLHISLKTVNDFINPKGKREVHQNHTIAHFVSLIKKYPNIAEFAERAKQAIENGDIDELKAILNEIELAIEKGGSNGHLHWIVMAAKEAIRDLTRSLVLFTTDSNYHRECNVALKDFGGVNAVGFTRNKTWLASNSQDSFQLLKKTGNNTQGGGASVQANDKGYLAAIIGRPSDVLENCELKSEGLEQEEPLQIGIVQLDDAGKAISEVRWVDSAPNHIINAHLVPLDDGEFELIIGVSTAIANREYAEQSDELIKPAQYFSARLNNNGDIISESQSLGQLNLAANDAPVYLGQGQIAFVSGGAGLNPASIELHASLKSGNQVIVGDKPVLTWGSSSGSSLNPLFPSRGSHSDVAAGQMLRCPANQFLVKIDKYVGTPLTLINDSVPSSIDDPTSRLIMELGFQCASIRDTGEIFDNTFQDDYNQSFNWSNVPNAGNLERIPYLPLSRYNKFTQCNGLASGYWFTRRIDANQKSVGGAFDFNLWCADSDKSIVDHVNDLDVNSGFAADFVQCPANEYIVGAQPYFDEKTQSVAHMSLICGGAVNEGIEVKFIDYTSPQAIRLENQVSEIFNTFEATDVNNTDIHDAVTSILREESTCLDILSREALAVGADPALYGALCTTLEEERMATILADVCPDSGALSDCDLYKPHSIFVNVNSFRPDIFRAGGLTTLLGIPAFIVPQDAACSTVGGKQVDCFISDNELNIDALIPQSSSGVTLQNKQPSFIQGIWSYKHISRPQAPLGLPLLRKETETIDKNIPILLSPQTVDMYTPDWGFLEQVSILGNTFQVDELPILLKKGKYSAINMAIEQCWRDDAGIRWGHATWNVIRSSILVRWGNFDFTSPAFREPWEDDNKAIPNFSEKCFLNAHHFEDIGERRKGINTLERTEENRILLGSPIYDMSNSALSSGSELAYHLVDSCSLIELPDSFFDYVDGQTTSYSLADITGANYSCNTYSEAQHSLISAGYIDAARSEEEKLELLAEAVITAASLAASGGAAALGRQSAKAAAKEVLKQSARSLLRGVVKAETVRSLGSAIGIIVQAKHQLIPQCIDDHKEDDEAIVNCLENVLTDVAFNTAFALVDVPDYIELVEDTFTSALRFRPNSSTIIDVAAPDNSSWIPLAVNRLKDSYSRVLARRIEIISGASSLPAVVPATPRIKQAALENNGVDFNHFYRTINNNSMGDTVRSIQNTIEGFPDELASNPRFAEVLSSEFEKATIDLNYLPALERKLSTWDRTTKLLVENGATSSQLSNPVFFGDLTRYVDAFTELPADVLNSVSFKEALEYFFDVSSDFDAPIATRLSSAANYIEGRKEVYEAAIQAGVTTEDFQDPFFDGLLDGIARTSLPKTQKQLEVTSLVTEYRKPATSCPVR